MEDFIIAVEKAIEQENWYAALWLALSLPDICGWVDDPNKGNKPRYTAWVKQYLIPKYTDLKGAPLLSVGDFYALRCSTSHAGSGDTSRQTKAGATLAHIKVVSPHPKRVAHLIRVDDHMQLHVDILCADVCSAARDWLSKIPTDDTDRRGRLAELLRIETSGDVTLNGINVIRYAASDPAEAGMTSAQIFRRRRRQAPPQR